MGYLSVKLLLFVVLFGYVLSVDVYGGFSEEELDRRILNFQAYHASDILNGVSAFETFKQFIVEGKTLTLENAEYAISLFAYANFLTGQTNTVLEALLAQTTVSVA
eukprot:TRINITY_DN1068_c0_g1_i4.p1 TRINITY_DN1068_c0_g1~~TRINITY_DN1068_c0_g1_i4.p1  ORF type:complete len:106 (-),score=14.88 TRINITY_DN1068_c0_g1_i4:84-401(-)